MSYGKQFAYLREQKGLTLEQVATGIMSLPVLQSFERGARDIAVGKLTALLARMGVSLRQFVSVSERLTYSSQAKRQVIHQAYMAKDTRELAALFAMPRAKTPTDEAEFWFFDHMLSAGKYYDLTGDVLCSETEVTKLSTALITNPMWGDAELDVLYWNIPLLGENRVFALSREVLRITNGLRDWNFALYGTAWNTVLAGLAYLVAENSNYAPSMVRQIDAQEPLAEALIANRLFYMLLKAVMATQRADTPSNRLLIQDVYAKAQVLHIPELEQKMQRLSTRALALDLNTPAK